MGAIPDGLTAKIMSVASVTSKGKLARWAQHLPRIAAMEPELQALLSDLLTVRGVAGARDAGLNGRSGAARWR